MNSLTPRERDVVALLCNGLSNKAIAGRLSIAEGTVKIHVHNVFQKLNVLSRAQLVADLAQSRVKCSAAGYETAEQIDS